MQREYTEEVSDCEEFLVDVRQNQPCSAEDCSNIALFRCAYTNCGKRGCKRPFCNFHVDASVEKENESTKLNLVCQECKP